MALHDLGRETSNIEQRTSNIELKISSGDHSFLVFDVHSLRYSLAHLQMFLKPATKSGDI